METKYLFIDQQDKETLFKLAQNNNLSVSATIDIISQELLYYTLPLKNYLHRGQKMICLHIRKNLKSQTMKFTSINYNNALYMYLHYKELPEKTKKTLTLKKYRIIKGQITKELKKRYDPNFNKNAVIRQTYNIIKAQQHEN